MVLSKMSEKPTDAASVILLRSGIAGEQALLIRRHISLAVFGGALVFPGGKLEPSDAGLVAAACRETFEETGILLARQADGEPCNASLAEALQPFRADISRDSSLFAPLLAKNGLVIDPGRFIMWSHWITPSQVSRRFDTRFFVARMPPDQIVRCDSAEATEFLWVDLDTSDGLADESLALAPPTRFSLGDLALSLRKHGGADRLMQMETARAIAQVMPKMARIDGHMMVLMPWDPAYQTAAGESAAGDLHFSAHYRGFPSRVPAPRNVGAAR
jgi:8-oxo-dGTP pyrophosphatase MutT (NUDIX family)